MKIDIKNLIPKLLREVFTNTIGNVISNILFGVNAVAIILKIVLKMYKVMGFISYNVLLWVGIVIILYRLFQLFYKMKDSIATLEKEVNSLQEEITIDRRMNKYRALKLYSTMSTSLEIEPGRYVRFKFSKDISSKPCETEIVTEIKKERDFFGNEFTDDNFTSNQISELKNKYCLHESP